MSDRRTTRLLITAAAACGLALAATGAASAGQGGSQSGSKSQMGSSDFVTMKSHHGYKATVSALKQATSGNGMMVMGTIHQAHVLSMTGLHLKGGEAFLVGNPHVGKMAFSADPAAGAVLPPRMYVYTKGGAAYVSYFKPSVELNAMNPGLGAKMGGKLDHKLHAIAEQATK